jgi:hypothetical protein
VQNYKKLQDYATLQSVIIEYLVKLRKAVIIKSDSLSYDKNKTLRFTA